MKIIKKISLIIIGILLSLVILEIVLQLTGFTIITIKKYRNKITKDSNTITVLCLGESTTEKQWPPILQKILDKKSKNIKFNIIDEGITATSTKKIAEKIENNLIKYNPDIVISMIGINDTGLGYKEYKIKFLNLLQLIFFHIATHYFYTNVSFFEIESECMHLIKNHQVSLAQKKYYDLLKKSNFSDIYAYWRLWELIENSEEVNISFYDKLLQHDKIFIMDVALKYILKYLVDYKNYSKTQIKNFLIENKNRIIFYYNQHKQNTELLEYYGCPSLMEVEITPGEENVSHKYIKTNFLDIKNTTKNYLYIIEKAYNFNDNIFFISMQYPTLSIEKLKKELKVSPYYDKLIFVSNEENFKQALQTHKAEEIFKDMFGGSFGHCTELGNTLIAENVAETILKLYN